MRHPSPVARPARFVTAAVVCMLAGAAAGRAAPGDWPEPRQNPQLTAVQPLPGAMREPPEVLARFDLGRNRPAITPAARPDGGGHVGLCLLAGALRCYDTRGTLLWASHPAGINYSRIVAADDLDGDGHAEVLLQAGRPTEPYAAAVMVSLDDGSLIWRYDVDPMSYAWYLYTDRYLPGYRSRQIVVIMHGYPPDKDNGYIALFAFPPAATSEPAIESAPAARRTDAAASPRPPRQLWRYDFHEYTCFPSFLQTDLDGDGVKELVVETHSRMWFLDAATGRLKHFCKWDVAPANVRSYGLVRFVDLDADGRDDFLCLADFAQHHEVLLNRGGRIEKAWHYGWPESVTTGKVATTWPEPPYADIDGDGRLEVLVSMFNAEARPEWAVRVYDAVTGRIRYRHAGAIAVACADLDADGRAEIVANASSDPTRTVLTGVCVLKATDEKLIAVWQEAGTTAVEPAEGRVRIRRGEEILTLSLTPSGQARLTPWAAATPAPTPDFSAVPAIQGPAAPTLLAADTDADGVNEILLYQEPDVRILGLDGGALRLKSTHRSSSVPVVADLDGDGSAELVLTTVEPAAPPVVEAVTPALGGRLFWRSVFPRPDRAGLPAPRWAYVRSIRLTGRATPDLYVWAGTPLVRSAGLDGRTGRILWEKGEVPNGERFWGPSANDASAWDYNGDGNEDLVFTNPDYYCVADGPTGEPLLGPLHPPRIFRQPSQGLYTRPVILAATNGDPTVCLVGGHYFQAAMSLRAEPLWYKLPPVGENHAGAEAFLRAGDGAWLMGFGRQNGRFACVNVGDGTVRWELPLEATATDGITCDVDGDGRGEFVFGTSHGELYAVGDRDGGPHVVWSRKESDEAAERRSDGGMTDPQRQRRGGGCGTPVTALIAADVNGDGRSEIIAATADGYVQVLGASPATLTPSTTAPIRWRHPAGIVTDETIAEVRAKLGSQEWARRTYAARKAVLDRWADVPAEKLRRVFPKKRGNVYHNFSCPADRSRLAFDPFDADTFRCPSCGRSYPPETDAGIYAASDRYHGTMYDGWACLFYLEAGNVAADMGLAARIEPEATARYVARGIEVLMLHTDTIERLQTRFDADRQMSVLLTYHREGDNKVLNDLACAYELLRGHMTAAQRERFERSVLRRMLDDLMLEPIYRYDHNNLYQWHRTIIQTALALERDDLIDWSFGYGPYDPEHRPEHRSIRRLAATHFKPDGAYWEMCSGYHLYPLNAFCELAVLSRNLTRMDADRFPPARYDLTDRSGPAGKVIRNALEWFVSMAMPDRTMPTVGDSMAPRAGMDDYYTTAEVGYRFFDVRAVGDYESLRAGRRTWAALLYGAPEITRRPTPFTSSCLSSGWVSLRNDWQANRIWVGLNALIPGGSHQHADRLTLLFYSHGRLLALEKATPYNEAVTRVLGTLSPSHNTVTVDKTSQKQGEALTGDEVPRVAHFFAGPVVQYAELHADRLYPQAKTYRRCVALVEDVAVDLFRVVGGRTHDWMLHHAGSETRLSVPTEASTFEPADWLANGTNRVGRARTDAMWDARWNVDGVSARLTMLGAAGTEVFTLETYPVANAVVTPSHPPCRTLCVRRYDDAPFLVVWDAWRQSPNLNDIVRGEGRDSVRIRTTQHTYHLVFGPGEARFDDGTVISTDGTFALLRDRDAITLVGGSRLTCRLPTGHLQMSVTQPATASAEWNNGTLTIEAADDIHYDTYGGVDHYRPAPDVAVTIGGDLWVVERRRYRVAGQTR